MMKKIQSKKIISVLYVLLLLAISTPLYAQVRNTDIVLTISPAHPSPNEKAIASLSSYAIDLDKTYISWQINARDVSSGVGKKEISFTTGNVGTQTNITANIETADGQNLVKKISILSSNIDLLWETTDAYVPPFYKGKALGPKEGSFKVVAVPGVVVKGERINSKNLSYSWKRNGNGQLSSSGWGKDYLLFKNSFLDDENEVEVKVVDIYENEVGKESIIIPTQKPKIVFYEKDLKSNVESFRALGSNIKINTAGMVLKAIPYFFSTKVDNFDDLLFRWFSEGKEVTTTYPKNEINVKGAEGKSGSGIIKLIVENENTLFQSAERQISVDF